MKQIVSGLVPLREKLSANKPKHIDAPDAVATAVAAIVSPGKDGLELLLIRRAVRAGDPWSGHMGLPGGRREPGDATLLETAVRETSEEIGVALPAPALLGGLDDLHPRMPTKPQVMIRPFVFGLEERPAARPGEEVAGVFWAPLSCFLTCNTSAPVDIMGSPVQVPCFKVPGLPDGLVVWGLTYRIICGLLPLL